MGSEESPILREAHQNLRASAPFHFIHICSHRCYANADESTISSSRLLFFSER